MWCLINNQPDRELEPVWYLPASQKNKEHIIGRKDGDVVLNSDQSISRKHATLRTTNDIPPTLEFIDMGSKFGSYIKENDTYRKLTGMKSSKVHSGEIIKLGGQWNEFRCDYYPISVLTSTVTGEERNWLVQDVQELYGEMLSDWKSHCSHLVMNKILLTVKVVCALAAGIPIVTPGFFHSFVAAYQKKTKLPNTSEYIPEIGENMLKSANVTFEVNRNRKTLFDGKCIVFSSKDQYQNLSVPVLLAGGKAVTLEDCGMNKRQLLDLDVIVMVPSKSSLSQGYEQQQLHDYLRSNGKRLVSESEIGLAILHCSIDKYCNPETSQSQLSTGTQDTQSMVISQRLPDSSFVTSLRADVKMEEMSVESPRTKIINRLSLGSKRTRNASGNADGPESKRMATMVVEDTQPYKTPEKTKENKRISLLVRTADTQAIMSVKEEVDTQPDDISVIDTLATNDPVVPPKNETIDHDFSFDLFPTNKTKSTPGLTLPSDQPIPTNERVTPSTTARATSHNESLMLTFRDVDDSNTTPSISKRASDDNLPTPKRRRRTDICEKFPAKTEDLSINDTHRDEKINVSDFITTKSMNVSDVPAAEDETNVEENISRSLVKIEITSLIRKDQQKPAVTNKYGNVKNFKKFRKVQSQSNSILPQIIGGNDLLPNKKKRIIDDIPDMFMDAREENVDFDIDDPLPPLVNNRRAKAPPINDMWSFPSSP